MLLMSAVCELFGVALVCTHTVFMLMSLFMHSRTLYPRGNLFSGVCDYKCFLFLNVVLVPAYWSPIHWHLWCIARRCIVALHILSLPLGLLCLVRTGWQAVLSTHRKACWRLSIASFLVNQWKDRTHIGPLQRNPTFSSSACCHLASSQN